MGGNIFRYVFVLLGLFGVFINGQICNPKTGPSGGAYCVKWPEYKHKQWATCLTDVYIQAKSKGKHVCKGLVTTYCFYQCQLEVHYKDNGTVSPDCRCGSRDIAKPARRQKVDKTSTPLPKWCLSPSGNDCSWYHDCLQVRYPCTQSPELQFATNMCKLYDVDAIRLTNTSHTWLNRVRQCQQVNLVPNIRPWSTKTCDDILRHARASNPRCFLKAFDDAPSICDLEFEDMFKIFWTLRGMSSVGVTTYSSFQSVIDSLRSCKNGSTAYKYWQTSISNLNKPLQVVRLIFTAGRGYSDNYNANKIYKQITASLKLSENGVLLFVGNLQQEQLEETTFEVEAMFVPAVDYDARFSENILHVDLGKIVSDFVNRSADGRIYIDGWYKSQFKKVQVCSNIACTNVTKEILVPMKFNNADNHSDGGPSAFVVVVIGLCGLVFCCISIFVFIKIKNAVQADCAKPDNEIYMG